MILMALIVRMEVEKVMKQEAKSITILEPIRVIVTKLPLKSLLAPVSYQNPLSLHPALNPFFSEQ